MFSQWPLTNDEKEEMMLQQALGRLSQPPSLPMDVDGLGMIEGRHGALPAGVPPLPVRALPAEHAMRPEQAQSSTNRQVPAAGSDGRDAEGPSSPQPATYQQIVCQHERVTSRGTNKFVRILLGCHLLLERERIPQVSLPKGQPAPRGTTPAEERQAPVNITVCPGVEPTHTCGERLALSFKQSGPVSPDAQPSPADSFKTPQSMTTSNVADFLGGELTADEATRAARSFQNAVELKLSQLGPGDTISSRTLIEALALSFRLAEVCHGECSLK
jgi:hypothetical protein